MITLFFAKDTSADLSAQLGQLNTCPALPPFAPPLKAFVAEFSRRVLQLPQLRDHPELATLAHWFRPAAIERLSERYTSTPQYFRKSRGMVFHLAPANVDVLFAYAWLMSLLAGNTNVARLSQKASSQRDALLSILGQVAQEDAFREVAFRNVFLTYAHDREVTGAISRSCHARIIWGGDRTVGEIRSIPISPLAVEIAFPDRFGVAAICASAITALQPDTLADLAHRFCNDLLWFSQQACSSPRTIYWVGSTEEIAQAKLKFWPVVKQYAAQRFVDEPAALMTRVSDAFFIAANADVELPEGPADYPLRVECDSADAELREIQSGYGLVVESSVESLRGISDLLDDRDQTLVEFGFSSDALHELLEHIDNRAIDRVVPVGRALNFSNIWDGTDFFNVFTRTIELGAR